MRANQRGQMEVGEGLTGRAIVAREYGPTATGNRMKFNMGAIMQRETQMTPQPEVHFLEYNTNMFQDPSGWMETQELSLDNLRQVAAVPGKDGGSRLEDSHDYVDPLDARLTAAAQSKSKERKPIRSSRAGTNFEDPVNSLSQVTL